MEMEARPGIEPGCEDLQSSTSPLRHRAGKEERLCAETARKSTIKALGGDAAPR